MSAVATLMDPPVRADGLCAECEGPRNTKASWKYAGVSAELDPFCSNKCARAWWGYPLDNAAEPTI